MARDKPSENNLNEKDKKGKMYFKTRTNCPLEQSKDNIKVSYVLSGAKQLTSKTYKQLYKNI